MAGYSYKWVRARIPEFVIEQYNRLAVDEYECDPAYDGDLHRVAADYIDVLEEELHSMYILLGEMKNKELEKWLNTRQKTSYGNGPWKINAEDVTDGLSAQHLREKASRLESMGRKAYQQAVKYYADSETCKAKARRMEKEDGTRYAQEQENA